MFRILYRSCKVEAEKLFISLWPYFTRSSLCLLQFYISVAVMAGLSIASVALVPPPHLPDLFPVLVSTTAFLHFLGTFIYFNIVQFSGPPSRKSQKKRNWIMPKQKVLNSFCFRKAKSSLLLTCMTPFSTSAHQAILLGRKFTVLLNADAKKLWH